MYRPETIKKFVKDVKQLVADFAAHLDGLKVAISKGNRKIGKVMNVSLAPIITCGNCDHCMWFCYDVKAGVQYGNVRKARARNTALALYARDAYFAQIADAMRRRRTNKYFRWHVGGEIPDYDYFCKMVQNAKDFPDFTIWTYTKMHEIVNRYCDEHGGRDAIPANFDIMFSEWDGMPINNPYNFPVFSCRMKAGNINHPAEYFDGLWKCPGNCDICKVAHRGCLAGESTYADEH